MHWPRLASQVTAFYALGACVIAVPGLSLSIHRHIARAPLPLLPAADADDDDDDDDDDHSGRCYYADRDNFKTALHVDLGPG